MAGYPTYGRNGDPWLNNVGTYNPPTILGPDGNPLGRPRQQEYVDGFALPLQLEFQTLFQTSWKQYWAYQYDESRRVPSPDFQLVMWRQLHLHAMLQERFLALQDLEWELEIDDDRDAMQVVVKEGLEKIIRRTPRLYQLLYSLHLAIWPGRSAGQVAWEWETMDLPALQIQPGLPGVLPATMTQGTAPRRALRVARHAHTSGDKILFKSDHTPMVLVYSPKAPEIPGLLFEPTQVGAFAAPLYGTWRNRFLIHQHWCVDADFFDAESQDAIHGTGLRSTLAWMEWMRQEWLGQAVVQLQRFGLGTRAWYFDASNPQALTEVKKRAKDQSDRANIYVPYWPSDRASRPMVENIETPITGTEVVLRLVEHVEYWQQRLINGQALTTNHPSSGGIGGGDMADASQSQGRNVTRADARMLAESLTGSDKQPGLVWLTFSRTYPELVGKMSCPRWKFNVPEEKAQDILKGVEVFVGMGGTVREDDARALLPGFKKPRPDEATLGGQQALAQAQAAEEGKPGEGGDKGGEGGDKEKNGKPAGPPAIGSKPPTPEHFAYDPEQPRDELGQWVERVHSVARHVEDPISGKTGTGDLPEHQAHKPLARDVYDSMKKQLKGMTWEQFRERLWHAHTASLAELGRLDLVSAVKDLEGAKGHERVEASEIPHPLGRKYATFHTINTNSRAARERKSDQSPP